MRHLVTYPDKRDIGGGGSEEDFEFRPSSNLITIASFDAFSQQSDLPRIDATKAATSLDGSPLKRRLT